MKITFIKTKKGKRLKEDVKGRDRFNRNKKTENEYVINIDKNNRINIFENKINENKEPNSHKISKENNKVEKKINNQKNSINNNHKKNNEKIMEGLKVIFKRNQLVLLTVALMLITAGYMNYNNSNNELDMTLAELGDAKLVSANVIENEVNENQSEENEINEVKQNQANSVEISSNEVIDSSKVNANTVNINEVSQNENSLNTSTTVSNNVEIDTKIDNQDNNYFVQTKLERETMYSQMIETYEKILENENIPADQKAIASNEIKNINDRKNAILIVENLIKTKNFEEVVILINDNNIDVVVKSSNNLTTEQVAQITNIVSRELKSNIEDIHISVHN